MEEKKQRIYSNIMYCMSSRGTKNIVRVCACCDSPLG